MQRDKLYKHLFVFDEITEDVVNQVYRDPDEALGQYVAAICLQAPAEGLCEIFTRLRKQVAGELANILCVETRLHVKKFTICNRSANNFDLYRNGIFLRRFTTDHYPFYIHLNISIKKTRRRKSFQSLLVQHGINKTNLSEYWSAPPIRPAYQYIYPGDWCSVLSPTWKAKAKEIAMHYPKARSA